MRISLLFLFTTFTHLLIAQSFSGTIRAKLTTAGGESQLAYHLTAEKVAFEMNFQVVQGDYRLIFVYPYQDNTHILAKTNKSGEKTAMELTLDQLGAKQKAITDYRFVEEKETKLIAGQTCQKYKLLMNDFQIETWICKTINPNLSLMSKIFKDDNVIQAMNLLNMTGFPMETIVKTNTGITIQTQQITAIESNFIESQIFELADYKIFKLD